MFFFFLPQNIQITFHHFKIAKFFSANVLMFTALCTSIVMSESTYFLYMECSYWEIGVTLDWDQFDLNPGVLFCLGRVRPILLTLFLQTETTLLLIQRKHNCMQLFANFGSILSDKGWDLFRGGGFRFCM